MGHRNFRIYLIMRHIRETRNEQEIENDLHTTDIDTKLFLC